MAVVIREGNFPNCFLLKGELVASERFDLYFPKLSSYKPRRDKLVRNITE